MMSAPVDADLLNAAIGPPRTGSVAIPIGWGSSINGWLEGNAVVTPEGRLVKRVVRVDNRSLAGVAAIVGVSQDGKEIAFNPERDFVKFPGGSKKFSIRWDARTKLYVTLTNFVPPEFRERETPASRRNTLAVMTLRNSLMDGPAGSRRAPPTPSDNGLPVCRLAIRRDDLIAAIRTAHNDGTNDAHNAHDTRTTFVSRRFPDWRKAAGAGGRYARWRSGDRRRYGQRDPIVIRTTHRLAGAVDSLTWNGREFIDSVDHGRQLQSASNFDCGGTILAETFNPTRGGVAPRDGAGPTSSSRLLHAGRFGERAPDDDGKWRFG